MLALLPGVLYKIVLLGFPIGIAERHGPTGGAGSSRSQTCRTWVVTTHPLHRRRFLSQPSAERR